MKIIPSTEITLGWLYNIFDLKSNNESEAIKTFVTDSREASGGDVFLSLSKSKRDNAKYAAEAKSRGAVVISDLYINSDIFINNIEEALLKIAKRYKEDFLLNIKKTVAITGSVGKTTAKETLFNIFSSHLICHASYGNYNNFLGVFYNVLITPISTELLILELGMNHSGEISKLSKAITPDIAVVTNVGTAHIGNLGSKRNIARAKLEVLDGNKNMILIAPKEEKYLFPFADITFSTKDAHADIFITNINNHASFLKFDVLSNQITIKNIHSNLVGTHFLNSIAIAFCIANVLSIDYKSIIPNIEALSTSLFRQKIISVAGIEFYDDSYSSSPEAVYAMMDMLTLNNKRNLSCALGDMLELGENAEALHMDIGRYAAKKKIKKLYAFGKYADFIARGAMNEGFDQNNIFISENIEDLHTTALQICESYEGELILIKASHAINSKRIFDRIQKIKLDWNNEKC